MEERGATGPVTVPMTDGRRLFSVRADITECYEKDCRPLSKAWEKAVLLSSIDSSWQEQLREMDELRKSVQNASYEQKDPLVIYKIEAFNLWKKMVEEMNAKVVSTLMRGKLAVPDYEESKVARQAEVEAQRQAELARRQAQVEAQRNAMKEVEEMQARARALQAEAQAKAAARRKAGEPQGEIQRDYGSASSNSSYGKYTTSHESYPGENAQREAGQNVSRNSAPKQPVKADPKIGRNDPCPCGSGKKYKNCHGKNQ